MESDWTLQDDIQAELSKEWYDQAEVRADLKLNTITVTPMPEDQGMERRDGTMKSDTGFLGPIKDDFGRTMTEYSIGIPIKQPDGSEKEMDVPSLIPGLTQEEINILKKDPEDIPESIRIKAAKHAEDRLKEGKSVFFGEEDKNETIVKNWSANYQTTNNPEKEARAMEVLKNFDTSTMPKEAVNAVKKAVYIFEGDKGQTAESITQNLNAIGAIESNYTTKVQTGGGPARSYWQVEPTTAQDNLVNGSALLGKKFNEVFERYAKDGKTAIEYLKGLTLEEWSDVLEKDDELGAAMAIHKLLRTIK